MLELITLDLKLINSEELDFTTNLVSLQSYEKKQIEKIAYVYNVKIQCQYALAEMCSA